MLTFQESAVINACVLLIQNIFSKRKKHPKTDVFINSRDKCSRKQPQNVSFNSKHGSPFEILNMFVECKHRERTGVWKNFDRVTSDFL